MDAKEVDEILRNCRNGFGTRKKNNYRAAVAIRDCFLFSSSERKKKITRVRDFFIERFLAGLQLQVITPRNK